MKATNQILTDPIIIFWILSFTHSKTLGQSDLSLDILKPSFLPMQAKGVLRLCWTWAPLLLLGPLVVRPTKPGTLLIRGSSSC
uniref:Uncharacterized protein n=1 Tax=Pyxicephalus adspersus TaxID=30357 RepID=A0AAV3A089_PYXAD|nr:TPA: hypothetical protein GDO54_017226 [Pyxicephalus adspersus]